MCYQLNTPRKASGKMHIAVVAPLDFGSSGGSFSYVKTMVDSLLQSEDFPDQRFTLFTLDDVIQEEVKYPLNISFRRIPSSSKLLTLSLMMKEFIFSDLKRKLKIKNIFRNRSNLRRILEAGEFDFVWFIAPSGESVDIPYATTLWDLEFRSQPFFPEVSSYGEWERRQKLNSEVLQRAAIVIVGTEYGARQIVNFFGVDSLRIQIAPYSVDKQRVNPDIIRDKNLIFFPAQFWAHKNHVTLVKAFGLARAISGKDLRLVLPGSDKGNLTLVKKYVESLGLHDSVHFPGFVPNNELVALYQKASLMCYPSLFGPDNLPPLEAVNYGCRVIVADIPGVREQLQNTVKYFEPFSESELAKLIVQELSSESHAPAPEFFEPEETLKLILNRVVAFECYIRTWKFLPS